MNVSTSRPAPFQEKTSAPLLLLGVLLLLTLGTSFLPASWFGIEKQVRRYEPLNLGTISQPENLATDTDNDGVISWKELVASSLSLSKEESNLQFETDPKGIAILNDPNNITASFTKNVYIASTALQQGGITDEASKEEVIKQLLAEESLKIAPKIYTSLDVLLTQDDKAAMKKYGNEVASILKNLITEKTITEELTSLANYLQTADETSLAPLVTNSKRVDAAIQKLLKVQVPKSALPYHVIVLNKLSEQGNMLSNLSVVNTDAMRATAAIKNYQATTISTLRTYSILAEYFTLKNITFSSNESGYIYVVGYTGVTH